MTFEFAIWLLRGRSRSEIGVGVGIGVDSGRSETESESESAQMPRLRLPNTYYNLRHTLSIKTIFSLKKINAKRCEQKDVNSLLKSISLNCQI